MNEPLLMAHPLWPILLPLLYLDQGGKVNGPRHRIQVRKECPVAVRDMVVQCPHDGKPHVPVRQTGRNVLTLNMGCPLTVNYVCSRSREAHALAKAVRAAMEAGLTPPGSLLA